MINRVCCSIGAFLLLCNAVLSQEEQILFVRVLNISEMREFWKTMESKVILGGGGVFKISDGSAVVSVSGLKKAFSSKDEKDYIWQPELLVYLNYYLDQPEGPSMSERRSMVKALSSKSAMERFAARYCLQRLYPTGSHPLIDLSQSPDEPKNKAAIQSWLATIEKQPETPSRSLRKQ